MEKPAKLGVKFFSNYKMKMEINAQAVKKKSTETQHLLSN